MTDYLPPKWDIDQTQAHQLNTLDTGLGFPGASDLLMLFHLEFIRECELQGLDRWLWRKILMLGQ